MEETPPLAPVLFRRILCAVDLDSAGEKALRWAADFAAEFQARLTVVHALPSVEVGQAHYFDQDLPIALRHAAEERLDDLRKRVGADAETVLEPGSVAKVVHNAATAQSADLVVIGRHDNPGVLGRLRANSYAI